MATDPTFDRSICPLCFSLYPEDLARADWPVCPDCDSEAKAVQVVPLRGFLAETPLEALVDLRGRWAAATGFREAYHAAKLQRIDDAIALKRRLDGAPPA